MKKIHERLSTKYPWYANWHNHPDHGAAHTLILLAFILVSISQVLHTNARLVDSNASDTALYNPHNRKGGYIPDDPEKVKKVPRLVVTKNKNSVQPVAGESIITMEPMAALPTAISLTTPTPMDQGGEGSCVAFATSTARTIEEHYRTGVQYSQAVNIFSPEYLYNQATSGPDCGSGSAVQTNLDIVKGQGVSTLQSMPYSGYDNCRTYPNTEQKTEAAGFKISSYATVSKYDTATIKTLLANNHPLIMPVVADNSFLNAQSGFIWKTKVSGSLAHAIVLVGYDDAKNAWKIQNSWGTTWGDAGYGWIDYDLYPTIGGNFYTISLDSTIDAVPPTVTLTSPSGGTSLSSTTTLSATATDNTGIAGVRFRVDGITIGIEDTTAPYSISWNAASFSSGTHTITAVARDISGNLTASSPVTVSVVGGDTIAPSSVSITSPVNGATVSGLGPMTISATDNTGIKEISFLVDGAAWIKSIESPFTTNLLTIGNDSFYENIKDGTHTVTPVAKDFANNNLTGPALTVVVSNPPKITSSNSYERLSLSAVAITWTTNKNSDSQVEYGTTTSYGSITPIDPTLVTSHRVTIADLTPGTLYHYRIKSRNSLGTASVVSGDYVFSLPSMIITSPADNTTVSGTITVSASTPTNITVDRMEFYRYTNVIGTDNTAPYDILWDTTTVADGTNTLYAKAYDAAGNSVQSAFSTFNVSNATPPPADTTAPTVSMATPTSGSTVSGAVTLGANATDNIGVTRVDFYRGTTLLGSDTSAPYSISWDTTSVADGTYSIFSKAYDAAANSTSSSSVSVTVSNVVTPPADTTAPSVSMTAPTTGATISGVATISASATDNVGVDHVDFYRGTTLIGADATSPYSIPWDTTMVANGTYSLSAKAYDAVGNSASSSSVSVTVSNTVTPPADTTAPTVSMTTPTSGSTVSGAVTLGANASDDTGVVKVSFYRGSTLIDTDTTGPSSFAVLWDTTTVANGTYSISAKASDAAGNVGTSSTISVTVNNTTADTTPPIATITSPVSGTVITARTSGVVVKGSGADNSGVIARNEILINGAVVSSNTNSSTINYKWSTRKIAVGTYTITLRTYDPAGNMGQTSVTVTKQ